jgi:hypothetical protein
MLAWSIGGRLLATEHGGTAALFMYEDARGQRLGLVLQPMARDLRAARADMREGVVNGCAWIAGGIGYAVVASLPDEALDAIADQVHREVREPAEVRRASIGVRLSAGHPSRAAMRNEANGDNCTARRSEAVRQRGARQSLPRSHPLAGPLIPINVV